MLRQQRRERTRLRLAVRRQIDVGATRVLFRDRPLGLAMADEPDLVQPTTGMVRSFPSRVSVRCMFVVTRSYASRASALRPSFSRRSIGCPTLTVIFAGSGKRIGRSRILLPKRAPPPKAGGPPTDGF